MAFVLRDRVKETTSSTGTGSVTLAGAATGFQSFSVIGNGNTTYYAIVGTTEWEVGIGTYSTTGPTLARTTVLESSNGGSLVNFSAGTKDVFVTYPGERAVYASGTGIVGIPDPGTSGNALISDGSSWTSKAPNTVTLTASGSISNGAAVIQNPDGTVSSITGTFGSPLLGSIIAPAITLTANFGPYGAAFDPYRNVCAVLTRDSTAGNLSISAWTANGNGITVIAANSLVTALGSNNSACIVYDPSVQRFVAFYLNGSNFGCARVFTVAGSSIQLLGAEVVFRSAVTTAIAAVYDPVSRKIVVGYNSSNSNSAIIATTSDTSISFGTAVNIFTATSTLYANAGRNLAITYDTVNSKAVFIGLNNSGTITGAVGTVSGTSISFGTTANFGTSTVDACQRMSATFDQNAGKCLFAYRDGGSGTTLYGAVGTVSGTSISFGTPVQAHAVIPNTTSLVYDPVVKKTVLVYNSNTNYYTVATISGTSVSFTTPATVATTANTDAQSFVASTYSPQNQTPLIFFYSSTLTRYTGTTVQTATVTGTNLVGSAAVGGSNFIGFSEGAYTNGQSAIIDIAGGTTSAQSGLLAGRSYYVQADGTLGLAPGPLDVYAGVAVSATNLIVKG